MVPQGVYAEQIGEGDRDDCADDQHRPQRAGYLTVAREDPRAACLCGRVAQGLKRGDDVRIVRCAATDREAGGMHLLLELEDDALRGLAANAGNRGKGVEIVVEDRELQSRDGVC